MGDDSMIRGQYEIVFKCVCGDVHSTEIDVGFVDHELAKQSAAYVYGDNLPQSLREFLAVPFFCRATQANVDPPDLNSFYFTFVQPIDVIA